MKNYIASLSLLLASTSVFGGVTNTVDPSSVKIKVYGVAASTNEDCSNAKVIGHNESGVEYDFTTNPQIASGNLPAGTYKCLVLYMSSAIKFTPATTSSDNVCVAGTETTRVLCRQGGCNYVKAEPDASGVLQYGSVQDSEAVDNTDVGRAPKVLTFMTTGTDGTGNSVFEQPIAGSNKGLPLGAALTIAGDGQASGTFVVNFFGKVGTEGGTCSIDVPDITFR